MSEISVDIIIAYLAVISVIAIVLTISDKIKAQNNKWRIKESTLIVTGLLGGAIAEYVTMRVIRHKTKHNKFMIGLPLIIILHTAIILFVYIKVAH